jgi:sodium/proline symporter
MIILSFCFFLVLFTLVGVLSAFKRKKTTKDYLLAEHNISPWLVALSAIATNNSGYMFIGMIGYTYMVGLSSIWLMIGWISGDFIASLFIHKKLRIKTEKTKVLSFASVLSHWQGGDFKLIRRLGGLITVIFLGTYAAAQLKAGSKALHVLLGWDYSIGAIIGAVIVLLYCFAGGIRASIWTDAAQSFVMVIAMGLLLFGGIWELGGFTDFYQQLSTISPTYLHLFPHGLPLGPYLGPLLFVLGWFFAGFGVVGQPHIMVRFMALDSPGHIPRVRAYYYSWYILFYSLTIGVGLIARLFMPEVGLFDAELALPLLAKKMLIDVLVGLVLAGLFAATMSTADSQILSCTAAITNDLPFKKERQDYWFTKIVTIFVVVIALSIALFGHASVFNLVLIAWSALACSFAPLLTVYAFGGKPSEMTAVLMMLFGLLTMLLWRISGWSETIYEIMPGIILGFFPYLFVNFKTKLTK